jgi:TP901 family phage tail tape measure protein
MASIGDLKVLIGANIDPLLKNLKQAEKNIQMTARNMQAVGDSMLKLTAPILGVATVGFKMAADFDDSMRKVQAVSGATGEQFDQLREMALQMGRDTRFSASESAAAMNYMGMAGWNTQQILSGLPGVLNLAAASGEDLALVSDIVTDGMTAFGLAADQSGRFADVLAAASSAANTNVAMMGDTFRYVAPVAGALGFSIEDTAMAIGLMANAGIKGSQAGTALRSMISRMVKPVGDSAKAMQELGLSVTDADGKMKPMNQLLIELRDKFSQLTPAQQAQMAASIAGQEAMSGMLALVGASDADFDKLSESIANSAGRAQEMADIMEGGAGGGLRRMRSALEGAAISLGDAFAPMVEKVVNKITELANWFTSLSKETKDTILQITLIVAGLGATFKVVGMLISGVGALTSTFKSLYTVYKIVSAGAAAFNAILIANPIGAIIAGIAALIAIITAAIVKYEKWGAAVLLLMGPLGMVINLIQSFRRHWDSIVSAFKTDGILAGLKRIGIVMLDAVLMPLQQLLELASKIPGIGNLAAKGAEKIEALRQRLNLIQVKPEKLEAPAKAAAEVVVKAFDPQAIAGQIEDNVGKSLYDGVKKGAEKAAKQVVPQLQSIGSSMFSNMFGSNMDFTRGLQEEKQPGGISSLSGDTSGQTGMIGLMDGALSKLTGTMTRMGEASQQAGQVAGESFQFMNERLQDMAASGELTSSLVGAVGMSILSAAEQGAAGMKDLGAAALDAGSKVVRSFIIQGVSAAASKALQGLPFPLNMVAGPLAGAAAGVLFNSLINKIRAPKLAKGGLAYGPTMAMVGDNPGANIDPEVISPLSKLKDMINSQVTVNLAGEFRMSGRDLWLVVDKENQIQKRLKGV